MKKIRLASVFSGIGAIEFAFKRMGVDHEIVFACDNGEREIDIDPDVELERIKSMSSPDNKKSYVDGLYASMTKKKNYVQMSFLTNYDLSDDHYHQDVRLLDGSDYRGKVDLLVGGSPCQSFSTVGYQKGLEDTRGTLFHDFARLVDEIQPQVFIFENVRGFFTHDNKNTWEITYKVLQNLGYILKYKILNSLDYGIPQNRRRVFVVGFRQPVEFEFPEPESIGSRTMKDFLEDNCVYGELAFIREDRQRGELSIGKTPGKADDKYILSAKVKQYVMSSGTKNFYSRPKIDQDVARPVLKTMGNRHRAGIDNYISVGDDVRMLTEREALRLMGFTDDFKIAVSRANIYKQAGNSIVVDVLMALMRSIISTGVFGKKEE